MIIEKLLPQELEDAVHKLMMSKTFPWQWNSENIVPATPDKDIFQMTHVFYLQRKVWSPYFNLVNAMVGFFVEKTGLKIKRVVRIKGNLVPNIAHTEASLQNLIHTDMDIANPANFVSFVYYVTDSDGDTTLFEDDGKTVVLTSPPKKGNCVWFNSKTTHRSAVPKNHKRRVVINFILELDL